MPDPYEVLGVPRNASQDDIKKAFRRKASKAHTDRKGGDHSAMTDLTVAYRSIGDEEARANFDRTGSDRPIVTAEQRARSILMEIFNAFLDQPTESQSLPQTIKLALADGQKKMTAERAKHERIVKRATFFLKNLSDADGVFAGLLHQRMENANRALGNVDQQLEAIKAAQKMSKGIKCAAEMAEAVQPSVWQWQTYSQADWSST